MAGQIRMTPGQMRQRSGEVRNQGETFRDVIDRMQSIINELQTEWEGQAGRAFSEQFDRLKPSFNDMRRLIDDIGTQLDATVNAVEQLDRDIASKFS
ncbi:MAG: WXG100 family type VII secretion target [Defluviitaleaceae bacterium]|nr:WXG100 family type VII secretion target [Defluviitaleaceae bacterium]